MQNLAIQVTYLDKTTEAAWLYPSTQVAFERQFNRGFLPAFSDRARLRTEWLLWAGWKALAVETPFDEWMVTVSTVDVGVFDGG